MKFNKFKFKSQNQKRTAAALALLAGIVGGWPAGARGEVYSNDRLTLDASLSFKEMYDSNVLLQSDGSLANKGAPVSVVTPALSLTLKNPAQIPGILKVDVSSAMYFYHDQTQESHVDHAFGYKFAGKNDRWSYESSFSALMVDGNHESFHFTSPDGAPAMGAPGLRDHRDQLLLRANEKLQYTAETWFVRPVISIYAVDYHITQKLQTGYCNFVNRSDYNAGFDVGYKVMPNLWAVAGYRFGYQDQGNVLANLTQASNTYQRALVGMEGEPMPGLKFNFLVGPDFRSFSDHALAAMEGDTRIFMEGAATWALTKSDELSLTMKHWTLPASGGKTLYGDSCYDLGFKHVFSPQWTARAGVRVLGGEWETGLRNDWVTIGRVGVDYKIDRHWSLETGYQYELGRSANRDLEGRDYDRQLVWVGGRYDF